MDNIFQDKKFNDACSDVLKFFKKEPFLCTFMSACLLADLKHIFPDRSFKISTGDLLYKNYTLFKQNFDINMQEPDGNNVINTEWDGHCWIELGDMYIIDVSLFRTIYSDAFTKPCKQDILNTFGTEQGCRIINKQNYCPFKYIDHNVLQDGVINGILKAVDENRDRFLV